MVNLGRFLAASTARRIFKATDIVADLHVAMAAHGRPEQMLTDMVPSSPGSTAAAAGWRWNASSPPWASA